MQKLQYNLELFDIEIDEWQEKKQLFSLSSVLLFK